MSTEESRIAVLEKASELQEDRLNSLNNNMATLASEFRGCIKELTTQLTVMNSTLANMRGFWSGIAFTMSILGAGAILLLEKLIGKLWP